MLTRLRVEDKLLISFTVLVILLGIFFGLFTNKVYAVDDPDSITIIDSIKVFRNYAESDDQLWIIEYNIEYEINPTEDPRKVFYAGIGNGTSILVTTPIKSYGYSFTSIYLDAATVTSLPIDWEGTYFVHLSGLSGAFASLSIGINQTLLAVDSDSWDTSTTSAASRTAAGNHILSVVENIEIQTGESLLTPLGKLNAAGTALVISVVTGATAFLTSIFTIVIEPLIEPSPTFFQNFQSTLEARQGDRLGGALEDLGVTVLGKEGQGQVIGTIGFLLIAITILGTIYTTTRDSSASLIIVLPLAYVGNTIGIIPLALMFVVFMFVVILFGITFILSRAG